MIFIAVMDKTIGHVSKCEENGESGEKHEENSEYAKGKRITLDFSVGNARRKLTIAALASEWVGVVDDEAEEAHGCECAECGANLQFNIFGHKMPSFQWMGVEARLRKNDDQKSCAWLNEDTLYLLL